MNNATEILAEASTEAQHQIIKNVALIMQRRKGEKYEIYKIKEKLDIKGRIYDDDKKINFHHFYFDYTFV